MCKLWHSPTCHVLWNVPSIITHSAWLLEDTTHQCLVSSKIVGRVASGFHLSPSSVVESQVLVFKSM